MIGSVWIARHAGNILARDATNAKIERTADEGFEIMWTRVVKQRRESAGREYGCQQSNSDACPGQSETMR
jgi:hypothetical protein